MRHVGRQSVLPSSWDVCLSHGIHLPANTPALGWQLPAGPPVAGGIPLYPGGRHWGGGGNPLADGLAIARLVGRLDPSAFHLLTLELPSHGAGLGGNDFQARD